MIGLGLSIVQLAVRQLLGGAFSPAILFGTSDQGVWYDPSDYSTLFQDSAGTVPVTAVEQPVGLMLDKSGRGNHATQATAINRPVLSARVNLLTKTEQFDDAVWTKTNTTVTANAVANPVTGNVNADALFETTTNGLHRAHQSITASATGYKFVGWVKSIGGRNLNLEVASSATGSNGAYTIFDLSTGALLASGSYGTGFTIVGTPTAISAGNEWYFCELEFTAPAGSVFGWFGITNGINNSYAGDITKGIYIWGADLRVANDGVGIPAYQRVNTATDYDSTGFPVYLRADGVDDGMVTNSIDFTATDKMTVVAGVRKLSDAAQGAVVELSPNAGTNAGTFYFLAPRTIAANQYVWYSHGSATFDDLKLAIASGYVAPITNVLTGIGNISGDSAILRVNAIQAAISTGDQGSGNFGNYPLYLFRRGGSSLPFNGRFYGMTIVNKLLSTAELEQLETYTNGKTKAFA